MPLGALLHVDRRRAPANGDMVVAELVVRGRLVRTVRRYTRTEGIVSLAQVGGRERSLIRPRYEISILGVVDGHVAPLDIQPLATDSEFRTG
jgi:hypothetical protein